MSGTKEYRAPRKNRIHIGSWGFDIFLWILMAALSVIFLYPFLNVVATSLSSNRMISTGQVTFYPRELMVDGYKLLFQEENILRAYLNTAIIAVGYAFFSLLLNSLAAYCLMVDDFVFRKPLSVILLITMFFNGGTVPTYLLIQKLGLFNSWWSLILPNAVSAYSCFVYRAFYKGISGEIREAARIDGMSEYKIYLKIMLPLSKPALSTLIIITFVNTWNDYLGPLIYLKSEEKKTIQLGLKMFIGQYSSEYGSSTS